MLKDFYKGLPKTRSPKKEFIVEVVRCCGVDIATVYNWVSGRSKPANPEHARIISELSGVPVDELF